MFRRYSPDRKSWVKEGGLPLREHLAVVAVFIVGIVFMFTLVIIESVHDRNAWEDWCTSQGGQVVDVSHVPPDQVTDRGARYCMVDGRAVGSR